METTYIASCSFGKDSIAMLYIIHKYNLPLDYIIFVEPMYTAEISGLHPKQKEFVEYAKIRIKELYNHDVIFLRANISYKEQFYKVKQKGNHIGDSYSFPHQMGAWCNDRLKMKPIMKFLKQFKNVHSYVGIAYDEPERHSRIDIDVQKSSPLFDYKITEQMAMDICKKLNLVSPIYSNGTTRDGCWFCHNQKISELKKLRNEYPSYYNELLKLQKDSFNTFKPNYSLFDLDKRFKNEDKQLKLEF